MRNYYTVLTVLWAAVIMYLSVMPGNELPEVQLFQADKFVHVSVYACLSWLCAMALKRQYGSKFSRLVLWIVAGFGIAIYGTLIEFIQGAYIQGRSFDVLDIIANIIGSITGISIFLIFFHQGKLRKRLAS